MTKSNYLERIATTGSRRAAIDAGIMPANIPIIMQIDRASVSIGPEIKTGKSNTLVNTTVKI